MPARYCAPGKARAPVRSDKGLNKAQPVYYNALIINGLLVHKHDRLSRDPA